MARGAKRRRIGLVGATLAAAAIPALAPPALAQAPGLQAPEEGHLRDRVLRVEGPVASAAAGFERYPDGDGHSMRIDDGGFGAEAATRVAGSLGALVHGDEMDTLSVRLVGPFGMYRTCGGGAYACYDPRRGLMVIAGEESRGRPSRSFLIAHEYGHHLAESRTNPPWSAGDWGTKRWATHEGICNLARRGEARPGDYSRTGYWRNPGEAFAEAFAFSHHPDHVRWRWSIARPGPAAYAAIRADVLDPWTGPETIELAGSIAARERAEVTRVPTPLDGRARVKLAGPARSDFDLRLADGRKRRLAADHQRGSRDRLGATVCGTRTLRVKVVATRGAGDYSLTVRRP